MSALWMLYAVAVAALLSVGAAAAERALRAAGRPGRGAWVAAIVGSWALPVLALFGWVGSDGAEAAATPTFRATEITVTEVAAVQGAVATGPWWETVADASREALLAPATTRIATLIWIAAAALGLLVVGVSVARLLRRSRRWPTASVMDEPVRLSPDFGPAVLGVFRPRIVLPRWILSLGQGPLRLILDHEREHRSARDTLLLTGATVAALAAPWNLPLWWQLRRLRMAVELDCDRRVLGRGAPVREYGELLMAVGGRISHLAVPAAALSEESSFLERRLKMMTQRRTRGWQWRAAAGLAFAGAMIFAACETPAPTNLNEPAPVEGEPAAAVEGEEAAGGVIQEEATDGSAIRIRGNRISIGTPVFEDGELKEIRVRGVESFDAQEAPAILYVDEIRVQGSLVSLDIGPEEIDRVEVIKGAAAETLYGAEAAGGIIQIFTKDWVAENEPERAERRTTREGSGTVSPLGGADREDRPIIYLDGVRLEPGKAVDGDAASILNSIDPRTIDRIEIIKGAAATERYGTEASAGVIQIYTKDGGGAREPEADTQGEFRVQEIRDPELEPAQLEPAQAGQVRELGDDEESAGGAYRFEARVAGPDEEPKNWQIRMTPTDPATAGVAARFTPDTLRAGGLLQERR